MIINGISHYAQIPALASYQGVRSGLGFRYAGRSTSFPIVEGIGALGPNLFGLDANDFSWIGMATGRLLCYTIKDSVVWNDPAVDCLNLRTSVPTIEEKTLTVEVFPNPNNGTFQLVLAEEVLQKAHGKIDYQVLDSTGRTVHTGNISSIETSVSLPALPAGVYLLHLPNTAHTAIPIIIQYP